MKSEGKPSIKLCFAALIEPSFFAIQTNMSHPTVLSSVPIAPPISSAASPSSSSHHEVFQYELPKLMANQSNSRNILASNDIEQWNRIITWKKVSNSSSPVYFVLTGDNELSVIKLLDSISTYDEIYFANELSRLLGSAVCDMRLIDDAERGKLLQGIDLFYEGELSPYDKDSMEYKAISEYKTSQCSFSNDVSTYQVMFLMNFLPAFTLDNICSYNRLITEQDLFEIGNLFGYDCFVANGDRFPCDQLFPRAIQELKTEGNPGNIMFSKLDNVEQCVYSVDSAATILNFDQETVQNHCKKLELLLKEIIPSVQLKLPKSCNTRLLERINNDIDISALYNPQSPSNSSNHQPNIKFDKSSVEKLMFAPNPLPVPKDPSEEQSIFAGYFPWFFFSENLSKSSDEGENKLSLSFNAAEAVKINYIDENNEQQAMDVQSGESVTITISKQDWNIVHVHPSAGDNLQAYYYIYCPFPSLFKLCSYLSVSSCYSINYYRAVNQVRKGFLTAIQRLSKLQNGESAVELKGKHQSFGELRQLLCSQNSLNKLDGLDNVLQLAHAYSTQIPQ
jgi:hypothetical protein